MAILAAVSRLKAAGSQLLSVIAIIWRHLLVSGFLYRDLLALADHLAVPCQEMASLARRWAYPDLPISVIDNPGRFVYSLTQPLGNLNLKIVWLAILIISIIYAKSWLSDVCNPICFCLSD